MHNNRYNLRKRDVLLPNLIGLPEALGHRQPQLIKSPWGRQLGLATLHREGGRHEEAVAASNRAVQLSERSCDSERLVRDS